jgi:hypothetical protein
MRQLAASTRNKFMRQLYSHLGDQRPTPELLDRVLDTVITVEGAEDHEGEIMKRTWWYFLAATTSLIVLTFPWDLQNHPHWQKVAWVPFVTGIVRLQDLLGNAALYFPFGYFMPTESRSVRVAAAMALSMLLSASIELAQVWSHVRFPSATDVVMNVAGSVAGALTR